MTLCCAAFSGATLTEVQEMVYSGVWHENISLQSSLPQLISNAYTGKIVSKLSGACLSIRAKKVFVKRKSFYCRFIIIINIIII